MRLQGRLAEPGFWRYAERKSAGAVAATASWALHDLGPGGNMLA